jgi:cell division protein FtsL
MGARYTYHTSQSVFADPYRDHGGASYDSASDSATGIAAEYTSAFESRSGSGSASGRASSRTGSTPRFSDGEFTSSFASRDGGYRPSATSSRRTSARREFVPSGSASTEYVYGNTARYAEPVTTPDVDFDVIRGHRRPEVVTLPQSFHTFARAFLAVAVALSVVFFVRVGFAAASVNVNIDSQTLAVQIEDAQAQANSLEVQQSLLMSGSSLQNKASELGMSAPESTTTITLPEDVVATDADGNLSLSGSLSAMASQE